jgi:hypothetical protein
VSDPYSDALGKATACLPAGLLAGEKIFQQGGHPARSESCAPPPCSHEFRQSADNPIDPTDVCRRVVPACQSTDTYPALWPSCTHLATPAEPIPAAPPIPSRPNADSQSSKIESNPAFALHLRSRARAKAYPPHHPTISGRTTSHWPPPRAAHKPNAANTVAGSASCRRLTPTHCRMRCVWQLKHVLQPEDSSATAVSRWAHVL